ncbi:MAG TPA: hypothetical protein VMR90_08050 [Candidatus Cybelea sp.]|nr:hypothetical protein [Candidatus Cybelea sp.]
MNKRWHIGLVLTVAMLVYGNALLNNFAMDDDMYIFSNPAVTAPSLKGLFEATKGNNIFRPVTFATFTLNWEAGRFQPFGYHLFNLLLHAAVILLLYLVFGRLLEPVPGGTSAALAAVWLFAVHPIHTEAVASIVGRSELLAAGFLLGAWLLHLNEQPIFALLCFALALLSKESAVVFLPLVLVGDYARGKLKPLHRYGWIAGVAGLYLALLWKVQGGRFGARSVNFLDNPLANLPAKWRILNALRVAWKYLGLQVYPGTLSCDYSYNAILLYRDWRHTAPAAVAAGFVLALGIWAMWTKKREWVLAGAIYTAGFAVTANLLVPTGTIMGERLAYLPSAGFCLLVALIWIRLKNRNRNLAWGMLAILVAALGARTMVRNRDWRDNFTLFSSAVRVVPASAKVHANLGGEYLQRDQIEAANVEFQTALRIYPDYPEVLEYCGLAESRASHDQEASRLLKKALSLTAEDSGYFDFRSVNLAAHLIKIGQNDDALKLLDRDIELSPGYSRAWSNRAALRYRRGELSQASADAENALRLDPTNSQARDVLAVLKRPVPFAFPH